MNFRIFTKRSYKIKYLEWSRIIHCFVMELWPTVLSLQTFSLVSIARRFIVNNTYELWDILQIIRIKHILSNRFLDHKHTKSRLYTLSEWNPNLHSNLVYEWYISKLDRSTNRIYANIINYKVSITRDDNYGTERILNETMTDKPTIYNLNARSM